MSLNPQLFFIPSFCLRPLLLPWDCTDSLHLQNDASELLCTTSKQTVNISRQRLSGDPTDPSGTHLYNNCQDQAGDENALLLTFNFITVWKLSSTDKTPWPLFLHLFLTCLSSLGPQIHLLCPFGVQSTFLDLLGYGVRKEWKQEIQFKFLQCRVSYTSPVPSSNLFFNLKKKNKSENSPWEVGGQLQLSMLSYPIIRKNWELAITQYSFQG